MNLEVSPNFPSRNDFVTIRVDERTLHLEFRDLRSHDTELGKFNAVASMFHPAVYIEVGPTLRKEQPSRIQILAEVAVKAAQTSILERRSSRLVSTDFSNFGSKAASSVTFAAMPCAGPIQYCARYPTGPLKSASPVLGRSRLNSG